MDVSAGSTITAEAIVPGAYCEVPHYNGGTTKIGVLALGSYSEGQWQPQLPEQGQISYACAVQEPNTTEITPSSRCLGVFSSTSIFYSKDTIWHLPDGRTGNLVSQQEIEKAKTDKETRLKMDQSMAKTALGLLSSTDRETFGSIINAISDQPEVLNTFFIAADALLNGRQLEGARTPASTISLVGADGRYYEVYDRAYGLNNFDSYTLVVGDPFAEVFGREPSQPHALDQIGTSKTIRTRGHVFLESVGFQLEDGEKITVDVTEPSIVFSDTNDPFTVIKSRHLRVLAEEQKT
jgi:hypothetical protein